jgi:hypothetical protein
VVGAVVVEVVAAGRWFEPARPDPSPEPSLHAATPPLARSDTSTATAARRTSGERSDLVRHPAQTWLKYKVATYCRSAEISCVAS